MNTYIILKQGDFLYNFRCRTRIAGGFMIRDYVTNQSKDNNIPSSNISYIATGYLLINIVIIKITDYRVGNTIFCPDGLLGFIAFGKSSTVVFRSVSAATTATNF